MEVHHQAISLFVVMEGGEGGGCSNCDAADAVQMGDGHTGRGSRISEGNVCQPQCGLNGCCCGSGLSCSSCIHIII